MQSDGTVQDIPPRGLDFLRDYIGRLKGYSPQFPGIPNIAPIPQPQSQPHPSNPTTSNNTSSTTAKSASLVPHAAEPRVDARSAEEAVPELPSSPLKLLERPKEEHEKGEFNWDEFIVPANLALPCNYSRSLIQGVRKERGCPFAGRGVYQVGTSSKGGS